MFICTIVAYFLSALLKCSSFLFPEIVSMTFLPFNTIEWYAARDNCRALFQFMINFTINGERTILILISWTVINIKIVSKRKFKVINSLKYFGHVNDDWYIQPPFFAKKMALMHEEKLAFLAFSFDDKIKKIVDAKE